MSEAEKMRIVSPETAFAGCSCCARLDRRRVLAGIGGAALALAGGSGTSLAQDAAPARKLCMEARDIDPNAKLVALLDYKRDVVVLAFRLETKPLREFFQTDFPIFIAENSQDVYFDYEHTKRVVFGDMYIARFEDSTLSLAAILAHETAHAFQVRTGIIDLLVASRFRNVKYAELHADYMTGAYSNWRDRLFTRDDTRSNRAMGAVFYSLGDEKDWHPQHHGSRPERWLAFQRGYAEAEDFDWTNGAVPVNQVGLQGVRYLQRTYFPSAT